MTQASDLFYSRYRQALEEELRQTFAWQEGLLYNMLLYQLGWMDDQGTPVSGLSGERIHPVLSLLSCESLVGKHDPALPAAAAVELVHNFALIHEDVQSGSPNRGQRPTVWWIWGPGQAINAGDGMHALARVALMRLRDRGMAASRVLDAMRLLDESCLTMCEGQYMDLVFQEKLEVGVNSYLKMATAKTGALMSCAMGLGALAATEDDDSVRAFQECGKALGVAYQIRADVQDLWATSGEGMPSDNVLNKKKLLPIVYTLEVGDIRTKRELGTIYFKRVLEPDDVRQVINILNEKSALEHAEKMIRSHCRQAMESLKNVGISPWGLEELEKLCEHITAWDDKAWQNER